MTHLDRGHYAKKHPAGRRADPVLVEAVRSRASEGSITCSSAFKIAAEHNVSPAEVGFTIDTLELRIVRCQLGLYGYGKRKSIIEPAASVEPQLETAIREGLADGRLPCRTAWDIADRFGLAKPQVAGACETLKIKLSRCQLGSF